MYETDPPHPRFLTIAQAAEYLNVGVPLIRALLKSGELRGCRSDPAGSGGSA
ncbi:excisionase family DNA-binding protein [Paenarthrobacter sp. S56]|uniref:excisionase family DNA-binding protein n=1 Tax=Paenarthrobacter sp. S56 TaxID=3138179 RepID=UPI003219B50E